MRRTKGDRIGPSLRHGFPHRRGKNGVSRREEPENSLPPERQIELARFMEDSARFFGCQFLIATHSPFVLAMRGARIYDLDGDPPRVRRWTELENVRAYYDFFREHAGEFRPEEKAGEPD